MADNGCKPSLSQVSQTSNSESSEHHSPGSFATLPSSGSRDSAIRSAGVTRVGYISSTSTNKKKNKTPPSEATGYIFVPRDPSSSNNNDNNNDNEQQGDMVTPPSSKRPRGRPRGSKNKPKPPIIIRQENNHAMHPILIEITPGSDVVEALIGFARHRRVGISILSCSGPVSDVMLRHPLSRVPVFPIHGPFHMLSLSGTYFGGRFAPPLPLPPLVMNPPSSPAWPACSSFSVLLAGTHGQVFGGIVGGKVLAAGIVIVMVTLFRRPEFHKLHLVDANGGDEGEGGDDDDDDAPFAGAVNVINNANANAAGSADPSGPIINNNNVNNNNAVNGVGASFNALPNMAATFGVVGSAPLNNCQVVPATGVGGSAADMNNVNVMQWNCTTHRTDNY